MPKTIVLPKKLWRSIYDGSTKVVVLREIEKRRLNGSLYYGRYVFMWDNLIYSITYYINSRNVTFRSRLCKLSKLSF